MKHKKRLILKNLVNEGTSEIEKFQNEVLRPVIKMQHNVLVASFNNYLRSKKIDFLGLSEQKKRSKITSIYKTDNNFKNITIGMIIGHFSMNEFNFYNQNSSEINRRILQIITQRIKDSILEIE
ncbi:MAG: glyoxalase [Polaribacter sp.]|uniref:glyoxalase n=1 Tax=Polaribacter sp. TaxID=1920175 RepID=UPI003265EB49